MRILLIYPGHTLSTIDIAQGYENGLRALGHTVIPFQYDRHLLFYQEALKLWARKNKTFRQGVDLAEATMAMASEQVIVQAAHACPDFVLVVCGFVLHRVGYDLLDKWGIPTALILTESPYLDEKQSRIIDWGHINIAFTNDRVSVGPLHRATGTRIEYLPHSYDPRRHHRKDAVHSMYASDVFFHGTYWPERERLMEPVRKWARRQGYKAHITGHKGKKGKNKAVDNATMVRYYSATKIALNHHRTYTESDDNGNEQHVQAAYSLGPRAYEIAACGAFQLCDDTRPELREVFGDSVPTYNGLDELKDRIGYFMSHPNRRSELAKAAQEHVQACSFQERADKILLPAIMEVLQ